MKKLVWLFATLLALQLALFAASKKSASVSFDQPVTVGTSKLAAGTYNVSWTEPGPDTKVTFSQGRKNLAEVQGTVVDKANSDTRILTVNGGSGKVLQGLDLKNASLNFVPRATTGK